MKRRGEGGEIDLGTLSGKEKKRKCLSPATVCGPGECLGKGLSNVFPVSLSFQPAFLVRDTGDWS